MIGMKGLTAAAGALVAMLSIGMSVPARAQMDSREAISLENQILDLRHQLQELQGEISGGGGSYLGRGRSYSPPPSSAGGPPSDIVAQLLDRVSRLEDQVRQLNGRVDETSNQVQRQGADLSKQIGDLSFQMQQGAGGQQAAAAPGLTARPAAPPPAAAPAPGKLPPRTPEVALQQGNAALARRDYAAAEVAAREVLSGGRGPRAYDAQFLLAQALNGQRNYQQAALAYDDTYNRSHTGTHAQDALLGLANSLVALGEKPAACATLDKLRTEFSSPRGDIHASAAAVRQRAGCH
jgi:TolA-binding protein